MKYRGLGICEKWVSENSRLHESEDKHLLEVFSRHKETSTLATLCRQIQCVVMNR
jgi:hypothetical protein